MSNSLFVISGAKVEQFQELTPKQAQYANAVSFTADLVNSAANRASTGFGLHGTAAVTEAYLGK